MAEKLIDDSVVMFDEPTVVSPSNGEPVSDLETGIPVRYAVMYDSE